MEKVLSVIGFVMMCIGGAGVDGEHMLISGAIAIIGLLIIEKESKKIDVPADQSRTSKNNITTLFLCHFNIEERKIQWLMAKIR